MTDFFRSKNISPTNFGLLEAKKDNLAPVYQILRQKSDNLALQEGILKATDPDLKLKLKV